MQPKCLYCQCKLINNSIDSDLLSEDEEIVIEGGHMEESFNEDDCFMSDDDEMDEESYLEIHDPMPTAEEGIHDEESDEEYEIRDQTNEVVMFILGTYTNLTGQQ